MAANRRLLPNIDFRLEDSLNPPDNEKQTYPLRVADFGKVWQFQQ